VGRYRSLKPWPSNRRIIALLPTPAPPSTTSLILSRSSMLSGRSHPGELEHDRENVAVSGWHHPRGGRSEFRPLGNPIRSPYPSRHSRPLRRSFLVRRILIWFPAAIPDRGGNSSGSINRDRCSFETITFFRSTTSHVTDYSLMLHSRGNSHLPRGNRRHSSVSRFELRVLLKDKKLFYYYLFTRVEYKISSTKSN